MIDFVCSMCKGRFQRSDIETEAEAAAAGFAKAVLGTTTHYVGECSECRRNGGRRPSVEQQLARISKRRAELEAAGRKREDAIRQAVDEDMTRQDRGQPAAYLQIVREGSDV